MVGNLWYFSKDLEGADYNRFLLEFYSNWKEVKLYIRKSFEQKDTAQKFLSEVEPFLIKETVGNVSHSYSKPFKEKLEITEYSFEVNFDFIKALQSASNSIFEWVQPHLPEDLLILDREGNSWLRSITHEGFVEIKPTNDEFEKIVKAFPDLLTSHENYLRNPPKTYYDKLYE